MENNEGFVIYNSYLDSYFTSEGEHFVKKIAEAKIFTDEGTCKWKIKKLSSMYKEVESFDEKYLAPKKVTVQISE